MPIARVRGGVAGGAGRLPPLPQHALRRRRRARATSTAPTPACRSPPSSTSSIAGPERPSAPRPTGADCSGARAGNLYIQYWTYYADSATLRGVPIVGERATTATTGRACRSASGPTAASTSGPPPTTATTTPAGVGQLGLRRRHRARSRTLAEAVGARADNGWGPETHLLLVSGGSHAGNAVGIPHIDRFTPGRRVHLIPLEPIAADRARPTSRSARPGGSSVWRDPEAEGTD